MRFSKETRSATGGHEYLIERVYSPSVDMEFSISPAQRDSLAEAKRKDDKRRSDDEKQARDKLLHNPDAELLFLDDHRLDLAEDDQDANPKLQAATSPVSAFGASRLCVRNSQTAVFRWMLMAKISSRPIQSLRLKMLRNSCGDQ